MPEKSDLKKVKVEKATLDDLFITRDKKGKVLPIDVMSTLLGKTISLVPATYGYIKKMGIDMQVSAVNWSDEIKLDFAKTHIRVPDISELTLEDMQERMGPLTLNHLVSLVVAHSIPMPRLRPEVGIAAEAIKNILLENDLKKQSTSSTSSDTPT